MSEKSQRKKVTKPFRNNFVGCSMNTAIPLESHENSFIVTLEPIDPSETKNDLDSFKIDVLHYSKRCPPMPRLISRYTELLAGKNFTKSEF